MLWFFCFVNRNIWSKLKYDNPTAFKNLDYWDLFLGQTILFIFLEQIELGEKIMKNLKQKAGNLKS